MTEFKNAISKFNDVTMNCYVCNHEIDFNEKITHECACAEVQPNKSNIPICRYQIHNKDITKDFIFRIKDSFTSHYASYKQIIMWLKITKHDYPNTQLDIRLPRIRRRCRYVYQNKIDIVKKSYKGDDVFHVCEIKYKNIE